MILYHFPTSPYSRRVRLGLAHKGLQAELRDARGNPAHREEMQRLNPIHTVPVLVDAGQVICQTAPILEYLEVKVPENRLFPPGIAGVRAHEAIANVDAVITILVDLGLRYAPLHHVPEFASVRRELGGRAQRALNAVAEYVESDRWLAAEFAAMTTVLWLEGLPARVNTFAPARPMLEVGVRVPDKLAAWAGQHRDRSDVRSLEH